MISFEMWLEGKRTDIANLQKNTVVTVFHGSTMRNTYMFCVNGIDAKHYKYPRHYNHISGGKPIKFGIFVAPDPKTAFKFGTYVIKFKTLGNNLIYRFPAEAATHRNFPAQSYPNSFRPEVSKDMLDKGIEPQSIFVGLLSPRAIEKVYRWENGVGATSMTREEFIAYVDKQYPKWQYDKSDFEPQEYKMSLEDFVKKIVKQEGGSEDEVLNILKSVYSKHGYLTGIGSIPYSLLRRIERQVANELHK